MSYDANSIQVKDFRSACRSLPGMYLGASGTDAVFNAFLEILNNSCDEAMMGRGNKIIIDLKDNEVSCTDFGAGAPRGSNKDCEDVLSEIPKISLSGTKRTRVPVSFVFSKHSAFLFCGIPSLKSKCHFPPSRLVITSNSLQQTQTALAPIPKQPRTPPL